MLPPRSLTRRTDGRVTAFVIIKLSIYLVLFVAVALFVLSAAHWLCVGRLRHLAHSRRLASLALPCVMVLAFVAFVPAAVSAGLVRVYNGDHNYKPEEHLNVFKVRIRLRMHTYGPGDLHFP